MNETDDILGGGEPLLARVRAEAAGATRLRLALGYLFLSGLAPVWDALDGSGGEIHLLIGNTAGQPTDEQRAAGAAARGALAAEFDVAATARAERARVVTETTEALRANLGSIARTDAHRRVLMGLAQGIARNRVRVRIYPDGRLHAKAYLFERAGATRALVGSSNVSLPSPGNPTELNVVVRAPESVAAVTQWFDALWAVSQDFSRDLFTALSASWPFVEADTD